MKPTQAVPAHEKKRSSEVKRQWLADGAAVAAAAVLSCAAFTARLAPFGVSLVAALSGRSGFFALVGAFIGYSFFGLSAGGLRYLAQAVIVFAVRWAFEPFFKKLCPWAPPVLAAVANLFVGGVFLFAGEVILYDILFLLSESVICGGATYFLARTVGIFREGGSMQTAENVVSLSVCVSLVLISLSGFKVGMISVGHILGAVCIMAVANALGPLGGACAGLSIGAALSIAAGDGGFAVLALSLGGMLSGLFEKVSRVAVMLVMLLCCLLAVAVVSERDGDLYLLYETMGAGVLFLMLPQRALLQLSVFFPSVCGGGEAQPNRYLSARLDFVSKSLSETAQALCEASEKRVQAGGDDMDRIFSAAADRVCRRCGMKLTCWDSDYTDTMDAFNHLITPLRQRGYIEPEQVPELFRRRCTKMMRLLSEINEAYRRSCTARAAQERCRQMRQVVTEQFGGMSRLLCEMSQELSMTLCDREREGKIGSALAQLGVHAQDLSCPVDRMGHRSVEFYCLPQEASQLTDDALEQLVSEECGRQMVLDAVAQNRQLARVSFSERAPYRVEVGSFQSTAGGEEVCGDSFLQVSLPGGYEAVLLSDGMGRGRSAAMESRLTLSLLSRFLKLGFTAENSVALINAALMLHSEEETLSTLDVALFDLYDGSVRLSKAGAAPSYLKRGRRISKVEMGSLPLGILGDTRLRSAQLRLSAGDVVVLASDGLCALCDDEIEAAVKQENRSPQQLAKLLGELASGKENPAARDDITVLVLRLV